MIPVSTITSPKGNVGQTLSFIAMGLTIAVGIGTLIYLRHQVKLVKLQLDYHAESTDAHKKNPV